MIQCYKDDSPADDPGVRGAGQRPLEASLLRGHHGQLVLTEGEVPLPQPPLPDGRAVHRPLQARVHPVGNKPWVSGQSPLSTLWTTRQTSVFSSSTPCLPCGQQAMGQSAVSPSPVPLSVLWSTPHESAVSPPPPCRMAAQYTVPFRPASTLWATRHGPVSGQHHPPPPCLPCGQHAMGQWSGPPCLPCGQHAMGQLVVIPPPPCLPCGQQAMGQWSVPPQFTCLSCGQQAMGQLVVSIILHPPVYPVVNTAWAS